MAQQNRFPEAIVAGLGTAAAISGSYTFPMSEGELVFSTDTHRLFVARSQEGGDFKGVMMETTVPASASAAGNAGDMAYSGSYVYICIEHDTWVRAPVATW